MLCYNKTDLEFLCCYIQSYRYILLTYTNENNIINIEKFCDEIVRSKFETVATNLRKKVSIKCFSLKILIVCKRLNSKW